MRRRGVIGVDVNGGGGIYISPTSPFWDELEELRAEQQAEKERRDRYGCLDGQVSLDLDSARTLPEPPWPAAGT